MMFMIVHDYYDREIHPMIARYFVLKKRLKSIWIN